jgi:hypothetical protein
MEKVAFVTYADGSYINIQKPLLKSIAKIHPNVKVFAFHSPQEIHPDCPPHAVAPYGFKVYAVEYARKRGYEVIIWLDSPNRLVRPIHDWLPRIEKVGVYLQADGWKCGQWANDKCLDYFGVTRDQSMTIQNCYACILAFDFRHPITSVFFNYWKAACQAGMFYGKGKNTLKTESEDARCLGHRYDQTCAELIAYKLGIPLSPMVLDDFFKSWIEV